MADTCYFPLLKREYSLFKRYVFEELVKTIEFPPYIQEKLFIKNLYGLIDLYKGCSVDELDMIITYLKKKYNLGFNELMWARECRLFSYPEEKYTHRFPQGKEFVDKLYEEWERTQKK